MLSAAGVASEVGGAISYQNSEMKPLCVRLEHLLDNLRRPGDAMPLEDSSAPGRCGGYDLAVGILFTECHDALVRRLAQVGLLATRQVGAHETGLHLAVGAAPEGSRRIELIWRVGRRIKRSADTLDHRLGRLRAGVASVWCGDRTDRRTIGKGVSEGGCALPGLALPAHQCPLFTLAAVAEDAVAHLATVALANLQRPALRHAVFGRRVGDGCARLGATGAAAPAASPAHRPPASSAQRLHSRTPSDTVSCGFLHLLLKGLVSLQRLLETPSF